MITMSSAIRSMERSTIHPMSCSGDDRVSHVRRPRLETPASPAFGERHPAAGRNTGTGRWVAVK